MGECIPIWQYCRGVSFQEAVYKEVHGIKKQSKIQWSYCYVRVSILQGTCRIGMKESSAIVTITSLMPRLNLSWRRQVGLELLRQG